MEPLAGTTVVCLAVNLPGPLAAARLAALGARVVKVEPPEGDPLATAAPDWYRELVAGQDVVALDLRHDAGRDRFAEILAGAGLLLTAMRPSALARLGIPEAVRRLRLGHVEIVGFEGDDAERPGHDLTYQALHGLLSPPSMPRVPVADLLGAERAVSAALLALLERERGGDGSHVRVVLDDAGRDAAAAVRHGLTAPGGVLAGGLAGYGVYATRDGFVAVAALERPFAERLAAHVGLTREDLVRRFAGETSAHWVRLGRDLDIPIAEVRGPAG
ncbi:CoA transferase [Sinomonas sp. R1AF57]|uniref:CoA transferase n=1 Tax=Sinomonas sp. R1AF57 TaxID=2020377 RepID=UPI000B5F825F|nr:CoA transferase [Sinomonas sp. R1AF57]ASN53470.1 CoA transferase [Sinomonas sp. R1AF57]